MAGWKSAAFALAAVLVGGGSPAVGDEDPAIQRLHGVGVALKTRTAWTAQYEQQYLVPGTTVGEVVSGRVWVAWPDRALFATGDPLQRLMGLAGRQVRLLDLEMGSCDDHLLTADEWERIPLVAVLEPENALSRFTVVAEGDTGLVLIPREPGGVSRVTLETGPDGLPSEVVVIDSQGATSTFTFESWDASKGPPDGQWLPAPPDGMECVGDAG